MSREIDEKNRQPDSQSPGLALRRSMNSLTSFVPDSNNVVSGESIDIVLGVASLEK